MQKTDERRVHVREERGTTRVSSTILHTRGVTLLRSLCLHDLSVPAAAPHDGGTTPCLARRDLCGCALALTVQTTTGSCFHAPCLRRARVR